MHVPSYPFSLLRLLDSNALLFHLQQHLLGQRIRHRLHLDFRLDLFPYLGPGLDLRLLIVCDLDFGLAEVIDYLLALAPVYFCPRGTQLLLGQEADVASWADGEADDLELAYAPS